MLPTTLLIHWPVRTHQVDLTPQDFKALGYVDIVGPDWRYIQDQQRNKEQFDNNKQEMDQIAFMKGSSFVKSFQEVGILVHPYVAKDDFLKYGTSSIDEYHYYFNIAKVDGIFTEFPYSAKLAIDYFSKMKNEKNENSNKTDL